VLRYDPSTRSFTAVETRQAGISLPGRNIEAHLVRPGRPVSASYGEAANRAAAPAPEVISELAQTYSLELPADAFAAAHAELEMSWAGDVARILVDGVILPLSPQAKVGLPAEAQQRLDAAPGDLLALDGVTLTCWTEWRSKRSRASLNPALSWTGRHFSGKTAGCRKHPVPGLWLHVHRPLGQLPPPHHPQAQGPAG
jgi:hypothetical protein